MQHITTIEAQLDEILRIARSNEHKQDNFQQYELLLLNSDGLESLIQLILEEHKRRFQLEDVTLLLYDPEYELQRLIEAKSDLQQWRNQLLFTTSLHIIDQHFNGQHTPRLMRYAPHQHTYLFPGSDILGSVALLPLIRQGKLIGSLNLGSNTVERFHPSIGSRFLQHLAAVVSACIENARLQEHIKLVGLHDPLTGINNRRFFDQRLIEEVSRAQRFKTPLSCLFIDLDHFKRVNDIYGHQAGDSVLKQVCKLLAERLRQTDVLARYGGEEFIVLLSDTTAHDAFIIAEQLRSRIDDTLLTLPNEKQIHVTMSVGLATMTTDGLIRTGEQLVGAADKAVYAAKLAGRNQTRQNHGADM